ncbi:MAG TPA: hypothetical protein VFT65_01425 [Candidatus Angelobacter sp.]|nr:hypothetical protein [Candidatus Angelobacter sp.]
MNPTLLYRIASILLILFAAGHTVGFLTFKPPTAEGIAVRDAMQSVQFKMGSGTYTYDRFYKGFGLFCTAYLLFAAFLAWQLGALARSNPQSIVALAWVFFALQVAGIVLSKVYFIPPPVIFSTLISICTGWAAWLVGKTGV